MPDDPYTAYNTYLAPAASQSIATELLAPCFIVCRTVQILRRDTQLTSYDYQGWNLHLFLFGFVASNAFYYWRSAMYRKDTSGAKVRLVHCRTLEGADYSNDLS